LGENRIRVAIFLLIPGLLQTEAVKALRGVYRAWVGEVERGGGKEIRGEGGPGLQIG
jgi:hypothetical protein